MSNLQFGIKRFGNFQCEERHNNHNKKLWEIEESHWRKIVEQNHLEMAIIQSKDEEWSTSTFKYVQLLITVRNLAALVMRIDKKRESKYLTLLYTEVLNNLNINLNHLKTFKIKSIVVSLCTNKEISH